MEKDLMTFGKAKWISSQDDNKDVIMIETWEGFDRNTQKTLLEDKGGMILLVKKFNASEVNKATVKATALGIFDLWINGERVGCDGVYEELKPGYTDFRNHVLYYEYDITGYLKESNTLLAILSNGWYMGRISFSSYPVSRLAFLCEIDISDSAGERIICSDESWMTKRGGIVRTADIWDGEYIDFNQPSYKELSMPECDISDFTPALVESFDLNIDKAEAPFVRIRKEFERKPEKIWIFDGIKGGNSGEENIPENELDFGEINVIRETKTDSVILKKGETAVVDFGQNIVGFPSMKFKGSKGCQIVIKDGELLNDSGKRSRGNDDAKGTVYSENYRSALSKLQYVLSGKDDFEEPKFTFFGFRYIQISASDDVEISGITGKVVGSETPDIGFIETSDDTVNKLISNIRWGQRGNYLYIPTDCPQRNERLGWTGDTQAFSLIAAYIVDADGFFRKWLRDARDSQSAEGMYPDVIPYSRRIPFGGSGWADAGIIVPYRMLKMYNDVSLIEEHYDSMEKYMAWMKTNKVPGPTPRYGDWLAYEPTDTQLIALVYYIKDTKMMTEMSLAVDKVDKAKYYLAESERAKSIFEEMYLENGEMKKEYISQASLLMALDEDLISERTKQKAVDTLKEKIESNGNRLSTGFLGTIILNEVLTRVGLGDLAYTLLLQTECPSWLFSVNQGATTMWERWNSYSIKDGFGPVGMNSFNHYAYGSIGAWMFKYMAGIDTFGNGFEKAFLHPTPDLRDECEIPEGQKRITYVKAEYSSRKGKIVSEWKNENGTITYDIETEMPSVVRIIPKGKKSIELDGKIIPVDSLKWVDGSVEFETDPGKHRIVC